MTNLSYAKKSRALHLNCRAALALVLLSMPATVSAGGTCLLHPQPFKLQSDTVRWSLKINSGGECIQGLRWSTIMIDQIVVTERPKAGRLLVQGPSFRYLSNPGVSGTDSFKLMIAGTSLRISGSSFIEVEVSAQ